MLLCALAFVAEGIDLNLIPLIAPSIASAWRVPPATFSAIFSSAPYRVDHRRFRDRLFCRSLWASPGAHRRHDADDLRNRSDGLDADCPGAAGLPGADRHWLWWGDSGFHGTSCPSSCRPAHVPVP